MINPCLTMLRRPVKAPENEIPVGIAAAQFATWVRRRGCRGCRGVLVKSWGS